MSLPETIENVDQLETVMTEPSQALVESLKSVSGTLLFLGVAGKMGPTLARLAQRALEAGGSKTRIVGVARFSDPDVRTRLEEWGIETIRADLLNADALAGLPDAEHVVYLAAKKFGSTGDEPLTWAMNTYLPAMVAQRYRNSRIVALSTGNVYPLTSPTTAGPDETVTPDPVGEYAQSCLGRERMFQHFSNIYGTEVTLVRLNYAIDLRYGVLLDIGQRVFEGQPVDLAMGHVNVIWQGDANDRILRSFELCASPPAILNVTSPSTIAVRDLADAFASRFSTKAVFEGNEAPTALLNNAAYCTERFGQPSVSLEKMIDWTAHWIQTNKPTLNKPTHFQTRNGKF